MKPKPPPFLAAVLSSIVSQLSVLVLFLLHHPSSLSPPPTPSLLSLLLLLHHSHASLSLSLTLSRKRKRNPHPNLRRLDPPLLRDGPASFRAHFNMSPSTFHWLSDLLEPLLDCRDPVGSKLDLSPHSRLAIGLYRLSTGHDFPHIARLFRVSERAARFCSTHLCRVLCTNFRFWLAFPNPNDLNSVSQSFHSLTGLSNCCGVIGCLRFPVRGTDQVIASQIVVDSNSRVLSIAAGFRGNRDNVSILKSSTLYKDVEAGRLISADSASVPQYFVGDSGYPLLPWLMVPYLDPDSAEQESFDSAVGVARVPLLKAVSSLRRWGVLSRPVEGGLRNAVAYIGSCAILHNALLIREDFSAFCSDVRVADSSLDHVGQGFGGSRDASVAHESESVMKARLIRTMCAKTAYQASTTNVSD